MNKRADARCGGNPAHHDTGDLVEAVDGRDTGWKVKSNQTISDRRRRSYDVTMGVPRIEVSRSV